MVQGKIPDDANRKKQQNKNRLRKQAIKLLLQKLVLLHKEKKQLQRKKIQKIKMARKADGRQ